MEFSSAIDSMRLAELNRAKKRIRAGKDAEVVLDEMANRIQAKILHVFFTELNNIIPEFDAIKNREEYFSIMNKK
jgi:glutamyl-tRNA reductase